jgi:hypothetical protein
MQPTFHGLGDAYVTKLTGDGRTLLYSTYLGGQLDDLATDVAVDRAGNAYVAGFTDSADFPVRHALQPMLNGGGDTFVTKLTPDGSTLVYATYLGGSSRGDVAWGIALDAARNVYLAGATTSLDFPVVNAVQPTPGGGECMGGDGPVLCEDAFVTKLRSDGGALVYSTYLGGRAPGEAGGYASEEGALGIAVDGTGNAYVAGITTTPHFPTHEARQAQCGVDANGLCRDGFVTKIGSTTMQVFVPVVRK